MLIKPAELVAVEALDEIGRALKAKGYSLKELVELGRSIREELIRDEVHLPDARSK